MLCLCVFKSQLTSKMGYCYLNISYYFFILMFMVPYILVKYMFN
jgi:hypothetical protein